MVCIKNRNSRFYQAYGLFETSEPAHRGYRSKRIEHLGLGICILVVPVLAVQLLMIRLFGLKTFLRLHCIGMALNAQTLRNCKYLKKIRKGIGIAGGELGIVVQKVAELFSALFHNRATLSVRSDPHLGSGTVFLQLQEVCYEIVVAPGIILYAGIEKKDIAVHDLYSMPVVLF